jgi:hypothetical protein
MAEAAVRSSPHSSIFTTVHGTFWDIWDNLNWRPTRGEADSLAPTSPGRSFVRNPSPVATYERASGPGDVERFPIAAETADATDAGRAP